LTAFSVGPRLSISATLIVARTIRAWRAPESIARSLSWTSAGSW
jgi:hypothetical protein